MTDRQLNVTFELNDSTVKKVLDRILSDAIMLGRQEECLRSSEAELPPEEIKTRTGFGTWSKQNRTNSDFSAKAGGSPR